MRQLASLLRKLEQHYGAVTLAEPEDPYELILYTNCGYPPSQENCRKGFEALKSTVGLATTAILGASERALAKVLRAGGIVPELRAARLKTIARLVEEEFAGDLRRALDDSQGARKALKRFPTIGDPGVDKILLFCGAVPVAAVPSNALQVPLRLGLGVEHRSYAASYRSVQEELTRALACDVEVLRRAYLLLRRHGREICRRAVPLCDRCPIARLCPYFRLRVEPSPHERRGRRRGAGRGP